MTPAGNPDSGRDWPEALCAPVRHLPTHSHLRIALSGGMDSVLLLHVAVRLYGQEGRVSAIHVNHQLQPNSDKTERFCSEICRQLGVSLDSRRVTVSGSETPEPGASGGVEEAARKARYDAFEEILTQGDLLLMAHHGDDQAETVLFRLLRGTGVAGLGGMPVTRPLGAGRLYRPMLEFSRSELHGWAVEQGIDWIEDPSNIDERFDRNFLRTSIFPLLKSRWPSLVNRVGHTAHSCREGDELAGKLAEIHFHQCAAPSGELRLVEVGALSLAEQKNLLRWWIRRSHYEPPALADWAQVMGDFLTSAADREPELRGRGFVIRRFQDCLHLVPEFTKLPDGNPVLIPNQEMSWGGWRLMLVASDERRTPPPEIRVSTRRGGERIRPVAGGPSKSLKNWLQEKKVPPWERAQLPLLVEMVGGYEEMVGAGDLWLSSRYCGEAPASGWRIVVERECN